QSGGRRTGVSCASTRAAEPTPLATSATSCAGGSRALRTPGRVAPTFSPISTTTQPATRSGTRSCSPSWRRLAACGRRAYLRWTPLERRIGVVCRHVAAAEVTQRKPVTRSLRGRALAEHLVQVPVHPLVAVEEAKHVAPTAEQHRFGRPRKAHPDPALAAGRVDDRFLEGAEGNRHLEHDPPLVELALGSKVRRPPVSERLDDHLVVAAGKAFQGGPRLGVGVAGELGADGHGRPRIGPAGGRYPC